MPSKPGRLFILFAWTKRMKNSRLWTITGFSNLRIKPRNASHSEADDITKFLSFVVPRSCISYRNPPASILRKKSRRNSSRPGFCLRAVQNSLRLGKLFLTPRIRRRQSVGRSERRAIGGVRNKCVKIRQTWSIRKFSSWEVQGSSNTTNRRFLQRRNSELFLGSKNRGRE